MNGDGVDELEHEHLGLCIAYTEYNMKITITKSNYSHFLIGLDLCRRQATVRKKVNDYSKMI